MFENLKTKMMARIERDCVKSTLDGEEVLMKKSKLPLVGDWGRIYPPVNEDGTWNLRNFVFGGKQNFWKLAMFIAIIVMVYWQFNIFINYIEYLRGLPCVQICLESMTKTPTFLG